MELQRARIINYIIIINRLIKEAPYANMSSACLSNRASASCEGPAAGHTELGDYGHTCNERCQPGTSGQENISEPMMIGKLSCIFGALLLTRICLKEAAILKLLCYIQLYVSTYGYSRIFTKLFICF